MYKIFYTPFNDISKCILPLIVTYVLQVWRHNKTNCISTVLLQIYYVVKIRTYFTFLSVNLIFSRSIKTFISSLLYQIGKQEQIILLRSRWFVVLHIHVHYLNTLITEIDYPLRTYYKRLGQTTFYMLRAIHLRAY